MGECSIHRFPYAVFSYFSVSVLLFLALSSSLPKAVVEDLKNFGHTVEDQKYFYNVVNAVEKDIGCIQAVSDSRKMGKAAGY